MAHYGDKHQNLMSCGDLLGNHRDTSSQSNVEADHHILTVSLLAILLKPKVTLITLSPQSIGAKNTERSNERSLLGSSFDLRKPSIMREIHETCHSVKSYFMKKDSKRRCDTTTPESIHTKDESKRGSAFAFIFGVN